jgi:hypothetical protein
MGSPCSLHKAVVAAPRQVGGSITCRRATKTLRGRHSKIQLVVTQEPAHKAATSYSFTLSIANPNTNTLKACAKSKNMINELLGGLENFFRAWIASHELQQSQMTRSDALHRIEIHS